MCRRGRSTCCSTSGRANCFCATHKSWGLDIGRVDRAFLSHGHYDHGGGLAAFLRENNHAPVYVHPQAFEPHFSRKPEGVRPIGLDPDLAHHPRIVPTGDVYEDSPNLLLFADVTGCDCLSEGGKNLLERVGDDYVPDAFAHEQSLIVYEAGKCILFTGCAHRGVVNLVQRRGRACRAYARCGGRRDAPLQPKPEKERADALIRAVGNRLEKTGARYLTGHCTGQHAYALLLDMLGDQIGYLPAGSQIDL